ncbi:MAG: DUF4956 domain-containing protein [Candidatus Marinimicrobia bacterium]|nr:DUF4956 domain-containing protein [Candidatus Neomarinimicrobiota bacterium]
MNLILTIIDSLKNINFAIAPLTEITSWVEPLRFLGIKLINVNDFTELLVRFALNTIMIYLVVHFMYAKNSKRKDFYFSYLAIGVIVFLLCFLLNNVKLELGFALGLFAIFGIIRYRTDPIPIKEMTYLFIVIGISVMNALANKKVSYAELMFTNSVIIWGLWLLEKRLMLKQEGSIKLVYEKIENIHPESKEILLADLTERTGINIKRYEIQKIDFLKDVAYITLYFNENGNNS